MQYLSLDSLLLCKKKCARLFLDSYSCDNLFMLHCHFLNPFFYFFGNEFIEDSLENIFTPMSWNRGQSWFVQSPKSRFSLGLKMSTAIDCSFLICTHLYCREIVRLSRGTTHKSQIMWCLKMLFYRIYRISSSDPWLVRKHLFATTSSNRSLDLVSGKNHPSTFVIMNELDFLFTSLEW